MVFTQPSLTTRHGELCEKLIPDHHASRASSHRWPSRLAQTTGVRVEDGRWGSRITVFFPNVMLTLSHCSTVFGNCCWTYYPTSFWASCFLYCCVVIQNWQGQLLRCWVLCVESAMMGDETCAFDQRKFESQELRICQNVSRRWLFWMPKICIHLKAETGEQLPNNQEVLIAV